MLISVALVLFLVGLFVVSTLLNQATDIPKECIDLPTETCSSCNSHHCSFDRQE